PDIPRDPRQLARDILSGKIKLEDLQRERQRQAGAAKPPSTAKPEVRQVQIGPGTGRPVSSQMPQSPATRPPQAPPARRPPGFPSQQMPPAARRQFPAS